ncbi:N-acetylglucosaminyl-phosphatidylinositol de-N-acetylase isoform X2 [Scaptodrosophila lebanonensis]|uniref:N-acetylglucosaminyl-phosphatidylinositol de-N-acetylase n=1 Tax=Drosophila lebanonensis TaxID=7225 RepID=A0A6J2TAH7_DROLE|nr:N-acetylglucosaminyl-phosphatidylinositol de-N-acetylase isoform X2 [Scaptodrosophila lebanonensis]
MRFNWLSEYLAQINTSAIYEATTQRWTQLRHNAEELLQLQQQLSPQAIYCRIKSTSAEALEHILIVCAVYLLVCLGLYKLTFWLTPGAGTGNTNTNEQNNRQHRGGGEGDAGANSLRNFLQSGLRLRSVHLPHAAKMGRVLLVTAHPDDECMFFGPLIYSLTQRDGCQVYVLCLSNGNFEQQAQLRREELWRACKHLGIPESNIVLMNATNLPDDPNVEWRPDAVANLILHTVESLDIQAIFTFDRDGVSSHPNHCAVYYAAASLCLANLLPKACKFYTLDTINIVRKYLSVFDLLCTCFMSTHWCILSWKEAAIVRRAMLEHKSQMKWFRWLYIYTSRYMFINSLREINLSDVELEMQIHDN